MWAKVGKVGAYGLVGSQVPGFEPKRNATVREFPEQQEDARGRCLVGMALLGSRQL